MRNCSPTDCSLRALAVQLRAELGHLPHRDFPTRSVELATTPPQASRGSKMKYSVYDRLLKREVGHQRRTHTDIRGIYGDHRWVDDLDIVNELEGHNGCVNALRYIDVWLKLNNTN